jgi:hypothetical protein
MKNNNTKYLCTNYTISKSTETDTSKELNELANLADETYGTPDACGNTTTSVGTLAVPESG